MRLYRDVPIDTPMIFSLSTTSTNVGLYTTMQLMVAVKIKDGDEERVAGGASRRACGAWRVLTRRYLLQPSRIIHVDS